MSENHRNVLFAIRYDLVKRFDITSNVKYFLPDELLERITLRAGNVGRLAEGVFMND